MGVVLVNPLPWFETRYRRFERPPRERGLLVSGGRWDAAAKPPPMVAVRERSPYLIANSPAGEQDEQVAEADGTVVVEISRTW
jgi:hypothetical protein